MTSGSTVDTLKRGGRKRKISGKMVQTQKVSVRVSLPPQPNYRNVRQAPPRPSSFVPNQPVRISPPEFRLVTPPPVFHPMNYAQPVPVLEDQGKSEMRTGSTPVRPDIAQVQMTAVNPNDIRPKAAMSRLVRTFDRNDPKNFNIVTGNIPPTLSQFQGGLGPLQESSTTSAIQPENKTTHLYSSAQYESSMGMDPVSAEAAFEPAKRLVPLLTVPGARRKGPVDKYGKPIESFGRASAARKATAEKYESKMEEEAAMLARGGRYSVF